MLKICKRLSLLSLLSLSFAFCDSHTSVDQKTVYIPMRDGVELSTQLYVPKNSDELFPCILIRTPGPSKDRKAYARLAEMGYVIAVQSLRSHHLPDDHPEPYFSDGWGELQDGYDTIEWLGESEYTNGKIGTFGASANGITQLLLAPTRPKHLKCQFIQVATPTLYQHAAYVGGKLCKHQVENWFAKVAPKAYENILKNTKYSTYWERIDVGKKAEYVQTPAIHIGGWYDIFSQGTIDSFNAWQNQGDLGARGQQKLVMGPWTHWGSNQPKFGEYTFPDAALEFQEQELIKNWFDYHLKDMKTALSDTPAVLYYTMGPLDDSPSKGNKWKSADSWPPPASSTPHYLNKSHSLTTQTPIFSSRKYSFQYDPKNPVPTIGGRNLYLESGPFDQSKNELREDVLSFTTSPLEKDTEVTGRILARIYLSSSAKETDLALTLTDVYPDGKSVLISEGIQHVKFDQQEIARVEVDLWSTSLVFAKDHKIRLSIASSNYPHFEINPHSAKNVIHVGSKYPSQIILPIVLD